jgi:hypothetical protein
MEYLSLKKNPYFALLINKHSKSIDIEDEEFLANFYSYLSEYCSYHWSIISDYFNEPAIIKEEVFKKSFRDFLFASNYLNTFFLGHFKEDLFSEIERLEKYLDTPNISFTSMKDYFIDLSGNKVYRKDPFLILEEDIGIKQHPKILFLLMYSKEFVSGLKKSYIYHKVND